MILDAHGNPIDPRRPHRFGEFVIPPNATVDFSGLTTDDKYTNAYGILERGETSLASRQLRRGPRSEAKP